MQTIPLPARATVVSGTHVEDLTRFFEKDTQLVSVPFPIPEGVAEALSTGRASWGWKCAVPVDAEGVPDPEVMRELDPRRAPASRAVLNTVSKCLELVANLFDVTELGVRITEATRPPCPRFHVDRIPARAVLTLEGPGSQYLLDADVRREKLGHGSGGLPDESSGLIVPGAHIHSVEEGRLSLFKGEEWPRNAGRALVHRSPPATGRRRWLMTVDLL